MAYISKIKFKGQEYEIKDTAARVAINGLMSGGGTGSGKDGVSVTNAEINQNGNLILTLSNGSTIDAGVAKGEDGVDGRDGVDGKDGINGRDGLDGKDGVTPVRGIDYWTEEDIEEIKNYIDESTADGGITEIPIASAETIGGIKVGENLSITEDGVLSATIPEVEIPEIPEIEPTKYFEGIRETDESDSDAISRIVGSEELNEGDICIVKTLIADSKYSYIAFVYTSNVWMAMDGNVDATNVYFADDITLAGSYTQVGNVTKTSSGTGTLSVAGKSIKDAFQAIFTKELNPTASQPSVSFNSVTSGAKEVGTSVTPSWNAKLNAGSYTYGPATGITATSWAISDTNGNSSTSAASSFPAFTVGDNTSYKITAKATYNQGAMPVTNLGNDYPSVRIAAGSKSATSSAVTGFRAYFYGTSTTPIESTSSAIRSLTNSGKAAATTNWELTIPEGTKYVYVAVAADSGKSLSKVEDIGAFGTDIVGSFTESTVSVEGVNGYTAANYKLYTYDTNGVALPANTYKIYLA